MHILDVSAHMILPIFHTPSNWLPTPQNERLTGKCVYFVRINPKGVSEKTWDVDMAAGDIIGPGALAAFKTLVSDLYLPILQVRVRMHYVVQPGSKWRIEQRLLLACKL